MSTIESESHKSLSTKSPDNLVEAGTQVEQPRPGEASARPEQEKREVGVIKLQSVLLDPDGIHIRYTWVQGGKPNVSYTLPLGKVQEMVQRGVCISSEGFDDSQGSDVEENLAKLLEFVRNQENLRRENEWDLLADTARDLSFPDSKNPTKVADEPNVSAGPETDTVAAQTQTDSSEQEPDSGSIESQINNILKNENCYARLELMQDFLTSDEFQRSEVSPADIQRIANAILTIVDRGIQFEGLQFVNYFLMEAHACLGILDKAIDNTESTQIPEQLKEEVEKLNKAISMESTQTPEQLKERLTNLFIRIRDEVVRFDYLVRNIHDISIRSSTPSEIIGPDNLSFLKLIYQKITERGSLVNEIIKEVFEKPFNKWVEANINRINRIAESILQEVNEGTKTRYENLRSILINYKQDLSWDSWNDSVFRKVLEECDRILETIR